MILYLASSRDKGRAALQSIPLEVDPEGKVLHPDGRQVGILCTTRREVEGNRQPVFVVLDVDAFDLAAIALNRAEAAKETLCPA